MGIPEKFIILFGRFSPTLVDFQNTPVSGTDELLSSTDSIVKLQGSRAKLGVDFSLT